MQQFVARDVAKAKLPVFKIAGKVAPCVSRIFILLSVKDVLVLQLLLSNKLEPVNLPVTRHVSFLLIVRSQRIACAAMNLDPEDKTQTMP